MQKGDESEGEKEGKVKRRKEEEKKVGCADKEGE